MYEVGQKVIYGIHGVCTVCGIERMSFGKGKAKYYVLEPLEQPGSRFYVPVENSAAVAKLRELLSREALLELLHADQIQNFSWISDDNQRKLRFRELLASGDREQLMGMICALYRHKREMTALGKKFHMSDEHMLNDAVKLMNAEFAQVFGLQPGEVQEFILKELENTH